MATRADIRSNASIPARIAARSSATLVWRSSRPSRSSARGEAHSRPPAQDETTSSGHDSQELESVREVGERTRGEQMSTVLAGPFVNAMTARRLSPASMAPCALRATIRSRVRGPVLVAYSRDCASFNLEAARFSPTALGKLGLRRVELVLRAGERGDDADRRGDQAEREDGSERGPASGRRPSPRWFRPPPGGREATKAAGQRANAECRDRTLIRPASRRSRSRRPRDG
jgi:hypothetical protein